MIGKLSPAPACVLTPWAGARGAGVSCHRVTQVSRSHGPGFSGSLTLRLILTSLSMMAENNEPQNKENFNPSKYECSLKFHKNIFLIIFRAKDDNCCII